MAKTKTKKGADKIPAAEPVAETQGSEPVAETQGSEPVAEAVAEPVAETQGSEPVAEAVAEKQGSDPVAEPVAEKQGSGSTKARKKRPATEDRAPRLKKRITVTNAFMVFCKEYRASVLQDNPELKMTEVSRVLGAKWREQSDESKVSFQEKARAANEAARASADAANEAARASADAADATVAA